MREAINNSVEEQMYCAFMYRPGLSYRPTGK